ncbi:MAG: fibro-slime domain-containing protein [Angelakisella sp.]
MKYTRHSPWSTLTALALAVLMAFSNVGFAEEGDLPVGSSNLTPELSEPLTPQPEPPIPEPETPSSQPPSEGGDLPLGLSDLPLGLSSFTLLAAAAPAPAPVYLPVTLYNYNHTAINDAIREQNPGKDDDELLLMSDTNAGPQNSWTGRNMDKSVIQGIVLPKLSSAGTPQSRFGNSAFFGPEPLDGKKIYDGYSFPFIKDDSGYFTFDSRENHLHMPDSGKQLITHSGEGPTLPFWGSNIGALSGPTNGVGFFPFNNDLPKGSQKAPADYYFGMNMSIPFTMKFGGHIDDARTQPMIFEFSGDDDVWVFIDGKLALDLGGIHGAVSGKIDFSKKNVTTSSVCGRFSGPNDSPKFYPMNGDSVTDTFASLGIGGFDGEQATEHTLQFFYLERGAGESRCTMRFNIADPPMSVTAGKTLDKNHAAHGDPIVTFCLQQLDRSDRPISTQYRSLRFEEGSTARQEVIFDDLSAGRYLLTELSTLRYRQDSIINIQNGTKKGAGVIFTLDEKRIQGSADFKNSKNHNRFLSHTDLAVNTIILERDNSHSG